MSDLAPNDKVSPFRPSLEKGVSDSAADVGVAHTQALATEFGEFQQLRQGLHQRHVQTIALAGTLGTGIFLSSGQAIAQAGPLDVLLAYSIIGTAALSVVFAAAEMGALVPLNGGIIRYAEHFVDPALSFANGWNEVYAHIVSVPSEISAAAVIVQFWTTVNSAVFITIFGAQYLGIGGALGRFLRFWKALDSALYAYSGIENITLTAAETRSPRTSIPMAAKRVFWKILIFYVITIFFVGLIVPSNDSHLKLSTGTAAQSPFVIAATRAGIHIVPSIINAVVLTSAWSAGNSSLLWGSRILFGLALEGRAPKFFTRTNRFSIPYLNVLFYGVFMGLAYMSLSSTAATVFDWLKDLVSIATLVNWTVITVVYLRFFYGCKKQGISRLQLPWASPLQPYLAWWSIFLFVLLLLTGGYSTFIHGQWDTETFVSSYINIPIFFILYFGYKVVKRSNIIPLEEIPVRHFITIAEQEETDEVQSNKTWRWLGILWS